MESWIIFAALAGLASNLFNIINRHILKDQEDSTAFAWLAEMTRLLIAFFFVFFDFKLQFTASTILLLIFLSIWELLSVYVFMKMHAYSHLSISTIISRTRLIWIPIIAFMFLGETLAINEYFGIIILFFGLSIAVSPHKISMDKGVQYAYASAFIVAVLSILMKALSPVTSTSVLLIGMSYISALSLPLIMKNADHRIHHLLRKNVGLKLLAGIANTAAMYLYVYSLKIGPVSKVTAIYQGMMVVSILAGIILLKERQDIFKKLLGTAITLLGVFMLTVF